MPSHKLTRAQVEAIVARREAGDGVKRLAAAFGVSAGAIHYHCLRHGAVSPRQHRHPVPTAPAHIVAGDGRVQRVFTVADDVALLALAAEGLSRREIARRIGRAYTSVVMRLLTLALREEMPA